MPDPDEMTVYDSLPETEADVHKHLDEMLVLAIAESEENHKRKNALGPLLGLMELLSSLDKAPNESVSNVLGDKPKQQTIH